MPAQIAAIVQGIDAIDGRRPLHLMLPLPAAPAPADVQRRLVGLQGGAVAQLAPAPLGVEVTTRFDLAGLPDRLGGGLPVGLVQETVTIGPTAEPPLVVAEDRLAHLEGLEVGAAVLETTGHGQTAQGQIAHGQGLLGQLRLQVGGVAVVVVLV